MPEDEANNRWNPDGCTLLPIVRNLIERSYLATNGKGYEDYQPVWMPDLPIGPARMLVKHDCTKMPTRAVGRTKKPCVSVGFMEVIGQDVMMCVAPLAYHKVYIAACRNCKTIFFVSAWDREDTFERFVARMKCSR